MIDFTEEQLERYSRHIILNDVGLEGQSKMLESRVLIIGAGGLGSPNAFYLAAAGIGTIGIIDNDVVDISNLQRQIIHSTRDIDVMKVDSAAEKIKALNPDVQVETYRDFVKADNIMGIIQDYDFVIDGTDNFASKFLINDACLMAKIPFSHGGILRFHGQTMTVVPWESACYRCVFNEPPPPDAVPSCSEAGVLGVVAGMLGTIQAAEALKYVTGAGDLLTNALLTFNARTMDFLKVKLKRQKSCPICGEKPSITELTDEEPPACDVDSES
ncbi:MAG: molybdopterin-synthase adenylyltransferase MoeB [Proteobacteria bacterium]|nr:molybdopterin-synthase adenylyltransferase MoeB [Pseudomonadota bacterium]